MDEYMIYPKQLQRANIPIENNRCFVIMPFKKEMDYIYGYLKTSLNDAGYICNRVDEFPGSTPIINKILTEIIRSRFIIADLTDCNPNVFYELGIAHSFKEAQNIIILKQKQSKIPFDLTHLTYIEYSSDNMKYLSSTILKCIEKSSYYTDFLEALNIRCIIPYIKNNQEYFIDFLKNELSDSLSILTKILLRETKDINEKEIMYLLEKFEVIFEKVLKDKNIEIMDGILKVYQEIFISCSNYLFTQDYVSKFLSLEKFAIYSINMEKIISWQTDMALALINSLKMPQLVLPWIVNYFSQSKTATIDLNRYKLEAFLMTNNHPIVVDTICNAVFDKNCYIREHFSDIIGEKRVVKGIPYLRQQLKTEENYYSAVSEIEALGKLNATESIDDITLWVDAHSKNIIEEKQYFILKHVKIALIRLDSIGNKLKEFNKKYDKYLKINT